MDRNGAEMRLGGVLGRLEEVLERENAAIGTDAGFDIKSSNDRKSRCLYELNMVVHSLGGQGLSDAYSERLQRVRGLLETNSVRVKAHLEAVRGVTDLINDAVRASEADGTYSLEQFGAYAAR